MNYRTIARVVALSFSGVSLIAMAARPPTDAGNAPAAGTGRQQVMPSMPLRDWHTGQHLPAAYRHYNFVMNDWKSHGLDAPPRGRKWLGINGDEVGR